jgi:hypothetical protein
LLLCLRIPLGGVQGDSDGQGQHRGMRGVYSISGAA